MATLNELRYDLLNIKNGGVASDDDLLSLRQISFWIKNTRAMLIRQDLNKKRSISDNIIQDLGCVPVQYVDAAQCCGLNIGCSILRTVDKIPQPIEVDYRDLITRVGPVKIDGMQYTFIPFNRAQVARYGRYGTGIPKAFYHNGYVFVLGAPDEVEYINIQGVFEDPEEVAKYNTCSGSPCYTADSKYPISAWMIEIMKQLIVKNNISVIASVPIDNTGDTKHNPGE